MTSAVFYNPIVPPYGLAEAFGYREKEGYYLQREVLNVRDRAAGIESRPMAPPPHLAASERIYFEPEIEFSQPKPLRVKARTFLTPIEISSATPIARYQGLTVGAKKKFGKGQVYYIGTNLGASIAAGDDAGMELVRAIVNEVARPLVTADKVRPRLVEGDGRSLLMVFNDTIEDQTARHQDSPAVSPGLPIFICPERLQWSRMPSSSRCHSRVSQSFSSNRGSPRTAVG